MTAKCNLIIDSCSDLPFDLVDREGVQLVYFPYIVDSQERSDDFFQSTTAHDFYQSMRDGATPSTAQLSMQTLEQAFADALTTGVPTVYLSFSSGLSGSFDAASLVLDRIKAGQPDAPLYVVDTLLGSTPEGLLVAEALRQRDRGLSAEELVAWVSEARYFVHTIFMVEDLESLHRGGRIPASVALVGEKLNLKPLLSFDTNGFLSLIGVARGRKKGLKQMVEFYVKNHDDAASVRMVAMGNADCADDTGRLKELLSKNDESLPVLESSIGPTIGAHVGPGMVSLCFWGTDRRGGLSVPDRIANKVKSS